MATRVKTECRRMGRQGGRGKDEGGRGSSIALGLYADSSAYRPSAFPLFLLADLPHEAQQDHAGGVVGAPMS